MYYFSYKIITKPAISGSQVIALAKKAKEDKTGIGLIILSACPKDSLGWCAYMWGRHAFNWDWMPREEGRDTIPLDHLDFEEDIRYQESINTDRTNILEKELTREYRREWRLAKIKCSLYGMRLNA